MCAHEDRLFPFMEKCVAVNLYANDSSSKPNPTPTHTHTQAITNSNYTKAYLSFHLIRFKSVSCKFCISKTNAVNRYCVDLLLLLGLFIVL